MDTYANMQAAGIEPPRMRGLDTDPAAAAAAPGPLSSRAAAPPGPLSSRAAAAGAVGAAAVRSSNSQPMAGGSEQVEGPSGAAGFDPFGMGPSSGSPAGAAESPGRPAPGASAWRSQSDVSRPGGGAAGAGGSEEEGPNEWRSMPEAGRHGDMRRSVPEGAALLGGAAAAGAAAARPDVRQSAEALFVQPPQPSPGQGGGVSAEGGKPSKRCRRVQPPTISSSLRRPPNDAPPALLSADAGSLHALALPAHPGRTLLWRGSLAAAGCFFLWELACSSRRSCAAHACPLSSNCQDALLSPALRCPLPPAQTGARRGRAAACLGARGGAGCRSPPRTAPASWMACAASTSKRWGRERAAAGCVQRRAAWAAPHPCVRPARAAAGPHVVLAVPAGTPMVWPRHACGLPFLLQIRPLEETYKFGHFFRCG